MIQNEPWLAIKYLKQDYIQIEKLHDFLLIVYEALGYSWENLEASYKGVHCFEIQALIEILKENKLITIKDGLVNLIKIKELKTDLNQKYIQKIEQLIIGVNNYKLLDRVQFVLKKNYLLKFSQKLSNEILSSFANKYGWLEVACYFKNSSTVQNTFTV